MKIHVDVSAQPDDESCGVTCLQAIYRYYGHPVAMDALKKEVVHWQTGGTVGVNLGRHALAHGFTAEIYTYNIKIFDPTWRQLAQEELAAKLRLRRKKIRSSREKKIIGFYLEFLREGGKVRFDDLDENLIQRQFNVRRPVICGLSSTYLYQSMRELPDNQESDLLGHPVGHFVVVSGYDPGTREVKIHDPLRRTSISDTGTYSLPFQKFSNALMLGILTYDANLLVIGRP
jgi:hypothetical protein